MEIRRFRWEDMAAVVDLMNRTNTVLGLKSTLTREQVESRWRAPYNHPERDAFLATETDGMLVGLVIADLLDTSNHANGVWHVLPDHPEAGRALMHVASAYFLETAVAASPPDVQIAMEWRLFEQDTAAIEGFESEGWRQVRRFYTMAVDLTSVESPPPLPDGLILRPFTADRLEEVYNAKVEIFQDHWGDQHDPLSEWQADIAAPDFDPSLWWVAYNGDHIVGMVLSEPSTPQVGWVGIVGVRRLYRKRGLAQTLLYQCFAEYKRRGFHRVDLGVDSASSTNAVDLYRRVGMHVHQTILYYSKELRPASG